MIVVNNVMKQPDVSPIKNASGKVIAYFKKDSSQPISIYLENTLDKELLLSLKKDEKLVASLMLLPKEIISLVFKKHEVNLLKKLTVEYIDY